MIISDATSSRSNRKKTLITIVVLLSLLLLFFFFPSPFKDTVIKSNSSYYCDMEVVENGEFVSSGDRFSGGNKRNGKYSKSGKYAAFLNIGTGNQYGPGLKFSDFEAGQSYKASVWRYREKGGDDGHLVVSAENPEQFYRATKTKIKSVEGWDLLEVDFKIPFYKEVDLLNVYVFSEGKHPIYFDDLLVQKIADPVPIQTADWKPETIQIDLNEKALKKLNKKRDIAFQNGILETKSDDWVKGKITAFEETQKVSLRLKGDWLDHLEGDKWSFRIKTKSGETINRLRYFSVHTPSARAYLHEWMLHELFKQEDILTTYYDFVKIELNEKKLGVYAIEEHFDKVLLERQKRREGPIIRFSEDGFWAGMKRQVDQYSAIDHDLDMSTKSPAASPATPFHEKKTLNTELLNEQFEQARLLMDQYKSGQIQARDIFDLDKLARYFAICETMGAYHGITWHNQRFYFNPIIGKLEPIGFDGYSDKALRKDHLLGAGIRNSKKTDFQSIEKVLFFDPAFSKAYAFYLNKYTSRSFLNKFLSNIDEAFEARKAFIQTEFEDYYFDQDQLIVNAQRLNSLVLPFNDYSVHAFVDEETEQSKTISVGSFHSLPIEIIGTGKTANKITDTLTNPVLLESFFNRRILEKRNADTTVLDITNHDILFAYDWQEPINFTSIKSNPKANFIFFKTLGIDSIFYSSIHPWSRKTKHTIHQNIFNTPELSNREYYRISDDKVLFSEGTYEVREDIIIPSGYQVFIPAGCRLDFTNKAKFISKSPVFANGREDKPILIYSSDKSAQGFIILQAKQESKLHFVEFNQFNTLLEKGWTLTGAVTFYESDVAIDHCVFKNNLCEDGLNIIRSDFTLTRSMIANTFSDGFDADFCKGTIDQVRFVNTGNDGMDFSGSVILIEEATVDKAGDKGLSVGEDSDVSVRKLSIQNSNIAVAAKDLSTLVIEDIQADQCNQGFTAYQKKPEYGGAMIFVKKYEMSNVRRLYNIQEDCSLQLVDKLIEGEALNSNKK